MEIYKSEKEKLIEVVSKQKQLKIIINDEFVKSEIHQLIYHKNKILGIKPIDKDEEETVFVVDYKILYKAANVLFKGLEIGEEEITLATKNLSWAVLFRGDLKRFIDYSYKSGKERNCILFESNFMPAIAITNGYDYNDKTRIYLLVIPKEGIESGFIVLNNFAIPKKVKEGLKKANSDKEKIIILERYFKEELLFKMKKSIENFNEYENKLKEIKGTTKELVAVTFDLLGKNRNIETLKSDEKLQRELEDLNRSANNYYSNKTNFQSVLIYIASNRLSFDEYLYKYHHLKTALEEKTAYKKLIKRVLSGKNKDEKELRTYIESQVSALDKCNLNK